MTLRFLLASLTFSLFFCAAITAQELLWELETGINRPLPEYEYRDGLEIVNRSEIDENTQVILGWTERGHFIGLEVGGVVSQLLYFNEGYDGYLLQLRAWRIGESFDYVLVGSFGEEDGCYGLQTFYLRELEQLEHWQEIPLTNYESDGEAMASLPEDSAYFMGSTLDKVRLAMHGEGSFSISLREGWYQIFTDDYPSYIEDRMTVSFSPQNWQLRFPRLESDR
ncbi:MAG: hypothetical protein AAF433_15685 [Bacteroidota bacterium]